MPTLNFGQVKRRVMVLAGVDNLTAGILVNQVSTETLESRSWSFLKAEASLSTRAPKTAGTVALTNATTITGTGTAFDATDVNSYIRVATDVHFHRITAVVGQALTIDPAYPGATFTGQAYSVFRHIYTLASDFRRMLSPVFYRRLSETTLQELDRIDPRRTFQSNSPLRFAYRGRDSNGVEQIEISPVPSVALVLRYAYLQTVAEATTDGTTMRLRPDVLIYAAATMGIRARIVKNPEMAGAGVLLSLAREYEAKAERDLQTAIEADFSLAGASQAVRTVGDGGWVGLDTLIDHDVFAP